jgi:membrane dipeptidase
VIDGHSDFAIHYLKKQWSLDSLDIERGLPGQADVRRWRQGGVNGALATVGSGQSSGSKQHFPEVLVSLDWFDALIQRHHGSLTAARSASDFDGAAKAGKIALMAAIEGGDQLDSSLEHLQTAYSRGVRSLGIVYDHQNAIGDGAMAMPSSAKVAAPASAGLSAFGRQVVEEMNRLGMIVDLSHAAERTALDAMRLSKSPVIFSHSAARGLCDTPRNLSDEVLREVAKNGGLVMVPLVPYLVTTDHWRWWSAGEAKYAELEKEHSDEASIDRGMAAWDSANPPPEVTVAHVADQIEYIAKVAGKEHVGIGTDFDGMGSFAIKDISDAAAIPKLLAELRARGWSPEDLHNLARGNFLRILRAVESTSDRES